MFRINRFAVALIAAFVLSFTAAHAAPAASPAPTTKAAPAKPAKMSTVEGTITKWEPKTSTFEIKATIRTWAFSWAKTTEKVGTPVLGARVKVTYTQDGKTYVAHKIEVLKAPVAKPTTTPKK